MVNCYFDETSFQLIFSCGHPSKMLEHLVKIQKIFNKLKVILGDQLTVIFSFQPKNPQIVPQSGLADEDFFSLGTKLLADEDNYLVRREGGP